VQLPEKKKKKKKKKKKELHLCKFCSKRNTSMQNHCAICDSSVASASSSSAVRYCPQCSYSYCDHDLQHHECGPKTAKCALCHRPDASLKWSKIKTLYSSSNLLVCDSCMDRRKTQSQKRNVYQNAQRDALKMAFKLPIILAVIVCLGGLALGLGVGLGLLPQYPATPRVPVNTTGHITSTDLSFTALSDAAERFSVVGNDLTFNFNQTNCGATYTSEQAWIRFVSTLSSLSNSSASFQYDRYCNISFASPCVVYACTGSIPLDSSPLLQDARDLIADDLEVGLAFAVAAVVLDFFALFIKNFLLLFVIVLPERRRQVKHRSVEPQSNEMLTANTVLNDNIHL
jgi:hypothetical protein